MQLSSTFFKPKVAPVVIQLGQPTRNAPRQLTTCMAKKKGVRCIVTLECTEARGEGVPPTRYTTQKVACLLSFGVHYQPVPGK